MSKLEKDVTIALEHASLEYISEIMEDIDPKAFALPKEASTKRIKRNVMGKLNNKNVNKGTNKVVKYAKIATASAASAALIMGSTMLFSEQVRAAVFGMFSFVPGKGIVEMEKAPGTIEGEQSGSSASDYYIMANTNRDTHSEALDVRLNHITAKDNILEISYAVTLNKVDFAAESQVNDKLNHLEDYEGEEYRQIFADYYKKLGYEQYFEVSSAEMYNFCAIQGVKSSVFMNQAALTQISSEILESEAGMGNFYEVVEKYDLSGMDLSQGAVGALRIADVEAAFTMEKASAYETVEEAMENVVTISGDRIAESIVCKPTWGEGTLSLELYYNEMEGNERVVSCMPVVYADGHDIYGDWPVQLGEYGERIEFDLSEYPNATEYSVVIEQVNLAYQVEPVTLDLSAHQYGEYTTDAAWETNLGKVQFTNYRVLSLEDVIAEVDGDERDLEWMPEGDYISIPYEMVGAGENVSELSFSWTLGKGAAVAGSQTEKEDLGEVSDEMIHFLGEMQVYSYIPLRTTVDQVDSITLMNPTFFVNTEIKVTEK